MDDVAEKVRTAAQALELHEFQRLVKHAAGGGALTASDRALIKRVTERHATPAASSPAAPATVQDDWAPLSDVAEQIGVNRRGLERRVAGEKDWPKLSAREIRGKLCVSASEAWRHFEAYGRRKPKGLRKPATYTEASGSTTEHEAADDAPLDVLTILNSVDTEGSPSAEGLKISLAEALRRHTNDEIARQKLFKSEDVVKMLRSYGDLWCELVKTLAPAFATFILKIIRERMDIDVSDQFSGAQPVLAAGVCEFTNEHFFPALKREVHNQVERVQVLEGVA